MQSSYSIEFNVLVERSDTSWDVYLRADDCIWTASSGYYLRVATIKL